MGGATLTAHIFVFFRTYDLLAQISGGRPLLHEHDVAVQPQPNLATVHPRLARTALEQCFPSYSVARLLSVCLPAVSA